MDEQYKRMIQTSENGKEMEIVSGDYYVCATLVDGVWWVHDPHTLTTCDSKDDAIEEILDLAWCYIDLPESEHDA